MLEKPTDDVAITQYARFRQKYLGRAMRTDRYRFVVWEQPKADRIVARELYDHETDPLETKNLADNADQAERVAKLEQQFYSRVAIGFRPRTLQAHRSKFRLYIAFLAEM